MTDLDLDALLAQYERFLADELSRESLHRARACDWPQGRIEIKLEA